MKDNYIPRRDGDLNSFEENFLNKLNSLAATLGINAIDLEKCTSVLEAHRSAFSFLNSKKAESKSATDGNLLKRNAAIDEIRRISKLVKGSLNYTTEIANILGLVGPELPFKNHSDSKPELKAKVDGMHVIIQFKKKDTDGLRIYSKRASETEFRFLVIDTSSPYVDSREKLDMSKPEQREYYAFYFDEDVEVGIQSDILKAIVP